MWTKLFLSVLQWFSILFLNWAKIPIRTLCGYRTQISRLSETSRCPHTSIWTWTGADWNRAGLEGHLVLLNYFAATPLEMYIIKYFCFLWPCPFWWESTTILVLKEEKNKCECMWKLSSLLNRAHAFLLLSPLNAQEVWWFQGIRKNRSISVYTPMNASCTMLPLKLLALSTSDWSPLTTLFFTPG